MLEAHGFLDDDENFGPMDGGEEVLLNDYQQPCFRITIEAGVWSILPFGETFYTDDIRNNAIHDSDTVLLDF